MRRLGEVLRNVVAVGNVELERNDRVALQSCGQSLTMAENTVFHAPWIMIFLSYLTPILKA